MLRLIPFSSPPIPIQSRFQSIQWNRQWLGIGVLSSLLIAGFSFHKMSSISQKQPQNPDTPLTIGSIAQPLDSEQHSKNCQPHETFRVSDRRCYQMQGE